MITLAFLLILGFAGWTTSAFISKGKHQAEIKEEVNTLLRSVVSFLNSLSSLFQLLIKDSIKSAANEDLGIVRDNVIEMVKGNTEKGMKNKQENTEKAA